MINSANTVILWLLFIIYLCDSNWQLFDLFVHSFRFDSVYFYFFSFFAHLFFFFSSFVQMELRVTINNNSKQWFWRGNRKTPFKMIFLDLEECFWMIFYFFDSCVYLFHFSQSHHLFLVTESKSVRKLFSDVSVIAIRFFN